MERYPEIQEYLYTKYYSNTSHSSVTSSHWHKIGGHEVLKTPTGLMLKGFGFGSRIKNNLLHRIIHLPELLLVRNLISKYPDFIQPILSGKYIAGKQGTLFNYDCARQVLALGCIINKLENEVTNIDYPLKTVTIIGDGYGYMGCLLHKIFPESRIISINLGKTLLFDIVYTQYVFPETEICLLDGNTDISQAMESKIKILFLEAENYELLGNIQIDLYINIASMQEMEIPVVKKYMNLMRSNRETSPFFYCCNREEKQLPDGQWVRFSDYGWNDKDEIFLDELCPWYQRYPSSIPPFWHPFDGPIRHRFARLSTGD